MRPRIILAAALLSILAFGVCGAATDSSAPFHTFYGEVKAVDLAAKTITIKSSGKSFVFRITNETKISSPNRYVKLDTIKPGEGATVVMRLGEGGIGIAMSIRVDASAELAKFIELYSLKTTRGETISGMAFLNYVVYQPPDEAWTGGITYEARRQSLFQLSVRPDGTVAEAKAIRGLGYPELDARALKYVMKWRFRPNAVTEARIPVGFWWSRHNF